MPSDEPRHLPTEDDLRFIWNRARVLFCIVDVKLRILAANPAWTELLGWREDQLVGSSLYDFIDPSDVERSRAATPALDAMGTHYIEFENRYRHADGSVRWIQWNAYERDGLWYGIGRDVTAMRLSHAALQRSERRTRAIIASMQEGLVIIGWDRRVAEVNDRFAEMVGWEPRELVGLRPPFPWWPPEHEAGHHGILRGTIGGDSGSRELEFVRRNGERFPVLLDTATLDEGRGTAPSVLAFVRDLSDVVDVRNRLREAHEIARVSSWEWNPARDTVRITYDGMSPEIEALGEVPRERLVGHLTEADSEAARRLLEETGSGERDGFVVDLEVADSSAGVRWVEWRGRAVRDASGSIVAVRGTAQDVTARRARD